MYILYLNKKVEGKEERRKGGRDGRRGEEGWGGREAEGREER